MYTGLGFNSHPTCFLSLGGWLYAQHLVRSHWCIITEKNSFVVSRAGAVIGNDIESTDVNLPSDPTLTG